MQYLELKVGTTTICFHNSWTGVETVEVNGQILSKKSSVLGTQHHFTLRENGEDMHYTLITKIASDAINVKVDLLKNGNPLYNDIILPYGSKPKSPALVAKQEGLKSLKMYDIDMAIKEFKKALKATPNDPELYFNLACAYSNKENVPDTIKYLKLAIENGFQDTENILTHDMLAFLRIQPEFKELKDSFTQEEF
jgi:tetratricopeptide (TPR) repeat protein